MELGCFILREGELCCGIEAFYFERGRVEDCENERSCAVEELCRKVAHELDRNWSGCEVEYFSRMI